MASRHAFMAAALTLLAATASDAYVRLRIPVNVPGPRVSVSGNGRYVAGTETGGGVCGPPVAAVTSDVFVFDRHTGQLECVSVSDQGARGLGSNDAPSLSADGQLVVFTSTAANLDARCGGSGFTHVYLRNRRTRHTECVSLDAIGTPANASSTRPRISALGNRVVFASDASNLDPADLNGSTDVFAVRLSDGVRISIERVSVGLATDPVGIRQDSITPEVSASGQYVVFSSARADLVPADTNAVADVFRRDLLLGNTIRVSLSLAGSQADRPGDQPAISADGRFVAFASSASNLIDGVTMFSGMVQIYRRDLFTGRTLAINRGDSPMNRYGEPNDSSSSPRITADGRFVLFKSEARNLSFPDRNGREDLFGADLNLILSNGYVASRNEMLTRHFFEITEQNGSSTPEAELAISADAGVIVFSSNATNLVPGDERPGLFLAVFDVPRQLITGAGAGGGPHVRAASSLQVVDLSLNFYAYDPGFRGGVAVASGDVDGDGAGDIITAAGPGGSPHVRVVSIARHTANAPGEWNGPGPAAHELANFQAYDVSFTGGVWVAAADVTGDGIAEIITGAGRGGGPHVRVFQVTTSWATGTATIALYAEFFAYDPGFVGGVRVAAGDLDGDGVAEIITAPGPGGGPHVRAFKLSASRVPIPIASFYAYDPGFGGGVFVAAADVTGDGRAEIVTGPDAGGGPHVRVFTRKAIDVWGELTGFLAYQSTALGGVRVAAGDTDGDGRAEIMTAPGADAGLDNQLTLVFGVGANGVVEERFSDRPAYPDFYGGSFVAVVPH
jgi:Tol biopolymer transport system component